MKPPSKQAMHAYTLPKIGSGCTFANCTIYFTLGCKTLEYVVVETLRNLGRGMYVHTTPSTVYMTL